MTKNQENEKVYEDFHSELTKLTRKSSKYRWDVPAFLNEERIFTIWDSLSLSKRKKLVSCKRWNNYPLCNWSRSAKKPYGSVIYNLVERVIMHSPKDWKLLLKYSEGIFAVNAFEFGTASEKIFLGKRLFLSKDRRVELRCLTFATEKVLFDNLTKILNESSYSVTSKVIKRIGFHRCYQYFLPKSIKDINRSPLSYRGSLSIRLASRREVQHLIDDLDLCQVDQAASLLISKISKEEALFHVNKGDLGDFSRVILQDKLRKI